MSNFSNRLMIASLLAIAPLVHAAPNDDTANVLMQAAMKKELVDGDLNGAIKQYAAIVAKYKNDRAVTAMALVHMAECYQKMGDAESRKIYEQVVREYGDQKEAVTLARAHLGPTAATRANAISTRRVWTAPPEVKADFYGQVSPDGRYIPYTSWSDNGNLFLHDLATGVERRLTDTADDRFGGSGEFAEEAAFSRDSKQLAYTWDMGKKGGVELRLIGLQATGVPQPRRLVVNPDLKWISPYSWSPDGKAIAVFLQRSDRSAQLGTVSVEDGSLHVLKSVEWQFPAEVFFSPDGKYLAYDTPANDSTRQRDVFVIAVDGSREIPAVLGPSRDSVVGWSPDGKRLVFASDRSGSMGLWALPFNDGKPQGPPELLKSDFDAKEVLGLTLSGAVYSAVRNRGVVPPDIYVAAFDFAAGKFLSKPSPAAQAFLGTNFHPSWSPDGRYLAYASMRSSHVAIGIRSVETGQVRELVPSPNFSPSLGYFWSLNWAPDGNSFIVTARGDKHGSGVFRVDAQTGATSLIAAAEQPRSAVLSPDGNTLYYLTASQQAETVILMKRDLTTGQEKELIREKYLPMFGGMSLSRDGRYLVIGPGVNPGAVVIIPIAGGPLREVTQRGTLTFANFSPDGRFLAARAVDSSNKVSSLLLIPVDGGDGRELIRGSESQSIVPIAWTPDSSALLVKKSSPAGDQIEVWRVPVDGANPQKIEASADQIAGGFLASPDGRQAAFWPARTVQKPPEIWVTENFLAAIK